MSERDPFAPVIEGFDCSGITDPHSLRCEPFFTDGENGGTLLDGSTVHDILAAKTRFSWRLNVMTPAQYAALIAATQGAEVLDTVPAYVYDATIDAVRLANFHVTRPACRTIRNMGQTWAIPQSELVLEEASPIARFRVTPPTRTAYDVGETLDLSGAYVAAIEPDGAEYDITYNCSFDPPDGATLDAPGGVAVSVTIDGAHIGAFAVRVVAASYYLTPPSKTSYERGDKLDLSGVRVVRTTADGYEDITSRCSFNPPAWTTLNIPGTVTVSVSYGGRTIGSFDVSVTGAEIIASGDWWTLYADGLLRVFKAGATPDYKTVDQAYEPDDPAGKIYAPWHYYKSRIQSVIIDDSVTYIGTGNFYWYYHPAWQYGNTEYVNLSSVEFRGATNIGQSSFSFAPIRQVAFQPGTESIGNFAFMGSSLSAVTIPESVKTIGTSAFASCALTSVTIAQDCTVGDNAFPEGCQVSYYPEPR